MSNFITSQIRTLVPLAVGALVSYFATLGLEIDSDTQSSLIIGLTGVIQAIYYLIVRMLEEKFPKLGILLGSTKKPEYEDKSFTKLDDEIEGV